MPATALTEVAHVMVQVVALQLTCRARQGSRLTPSLCAILCLCFPALFPHPVALMHVAERRTNAERGSLAHLCQPTGIWIKFLYRRDELVLSAIFYIMAMEFLLHCHATCRHADLSSGCRTCFDIHTSPSMDENACLRGRIGWVAFSICHIDRLCLQINKLSKKSV